LSRGFVVNKVNVCWSEEFDIPSFRFGDILLSSDSLHKIEKVLKDYENLDEDLDWVSKIIYSVLVGEVHKHIKEEQTIEYIQNTINSLSRKNTEPLSKKIVKDSIERINFGFPSEFKAKTESGDDVYIHFRYGDVTIKINDKRNFE
jgi:hypothetical protein